jgi:Spy/CpxP family protein refolding chaperone
MKTYRLLPLFALSALMAAPLLRADDTPPTPPPAHKEGRGDRLKELAERLNLTDDQKAKIKPILQDEMKALKALREDDTLDKDAKREKMMEIRKAHAAQILAILTPEQQAKFKAMQERRKGPDGGEAPHPAS